MVSGVPRTSVVVLVVVALALAAVASDQARGQEPVVMLTPVADIDYPTALAARPGDDALYVAEQDGRVTAIRDGVVDPTPVLDIGDRVSLGRREQGLLGMTFSPDGSRLYVHFTNVDGDTRLEEYAMHDRGADEASRRELLAVDQPDFNHNGGS